MGLMLINIDEESRKVLDHQIEKNDKEKEQD
jgi:hypothetical protein